MCTVGLVIRKESRDPYDTAGGMIVKIIKKRQENAFVVSFLPFVHLKSELFQLPMACGRPRAEKYLQFGGKIPTHIGGKKWKPLEAGAEKGGGNEHKKSGATEQGQDT
jgi:hypothetical protein